MSRIFTRQTYQRARRRKRLYLRVLPSVVSQVLTFTDTITVLKKKLRAYLTGSY